MRVTADLDTLMSDKVWVLLGARRNEYFVILGVFASRRAAEGEWRRVRNPLDEESYDIFRIEEWAVLHDQS